MRSTILEKYREGQEVRKRVGDVLTSIGKTAILFYLNDGKRGFSEMREYLGVPDGTLWYYLIMLQNANLLEKSDDGYYITSLGKKVAKVVRRAWKDSEGIKV